MTTYVTKYGTIRETASGEYLLPDGMNQRQWKKAKREVLRLKAEAGTLEAVALDADIVAGAVVCEDGTVFAATADASEHSVDGIEKAVPAYSTMYRGGKVYINRSVYYTRIARFEIVEMVESGTDSLFHAISTAKSNCS